LESTGIYFIYAAIFQFAKHFPDRTFDTVLIDAFNREIQTMFDDTRDFIQAHFRFAPRTDSVFWRANKELTMTDNFLEKVAMYQAGMPINAPTNDEATYYGNFEAEFRNFWTNGSYYCIFAGLDMLPERPLPALAYKPESIRRAQPLLADVKRQQQKMLDTLPTNYEYLRQLHGR
jgi:tryptophan halogenase